LRIGESDIAVAPYTTDADLAIDPSKLQDKPDLSNLMEEAGFELTMRPGTWTRMTNKGQVDFLVPSSLGGSGRRGAILGTHGTDVARKANGLEAAIIDQSLLRVSAFEESDTRSYNVLVAGSAALLVAKLLLTDNKNRLRNFEFANRKRALLCSVSETKTIRHSLLKEREALGFLRVAFRISADCLQSNIAPKLEQTISSSTNSVFR
jgi:hypothetical protein